ncbi:MAG: sensor histidine kinase [Lentisphaeria bacterium]
MRVFSKLPGLKNLSFRMVLIFYIVLPLVGSLILAGYFALRIWEERVEERMQNDLEMVARAIQLPVSKAVERNRQEGLEGALESAFSLDSIYSAYAYDKEGKKIASAGKKDPEPEEEDKLNEIVSEGEDKGEYGEVAKRRVYSYFVPLKNSENHNSGLLQLTRRERDFREYVKKIRLYGLLWLSLGIGIMIVLVLFGQYQALGRYFQRLINGMQRVANGEVNHRVPLNGPKEIVSITGTFNQMLDSIQQAESEIRCNQEEQARLEKKLHQQEKLAAIGQLAAGVAHELGTPLSTISGTAQRGARQEEDGSKNAKNFARIRREVDRMQTIIRQLLDFSHSHNLQLRKLRPQQVAKSAVEAIRAEAERYNAEVTIEGDNNAPAFSADPVRLEQALTNLLNNAIQVKEGITVKLSWSVKDDQLVYAVDDSGPGIPDDIRPHLFEPFFTTKNVGSGTGLGLAVVHGIAKEHGGSVEAKDSELGGARLEIHLPLYPES